MSYAIAALVSLVLIVITSIRAEKLLTKMMVFLGIGLVTFVTMSGTEEVHHAIKDYIQFITLPLCTVLTASLGLFSIRTEREVKLGWFLLIVCPIIGNMGTTWALAPIGLSLAALLRKQYPQRWLYILMTVCIFSMNFMALGTVLADPPQGYLAMQLSAQGKPVTFFFTLKHFWLYILATSVLYYISLTRLGVQFGSLSSLRMYRPASWGRFAYGLGIAGAIAFALMKLSGYQIPLFLGAVFLLGCALSKTPLFTKEEAHNTIHWGAETAAVFIAFFSVVAFAHKALHATDGIAHELMSGIVVIMTLFADNAAAFAAGYQHYEPLPEPFMYWYNLFPSVVFGGGSPVGNGPQITLFLVILVALGYTRAKEVFITWFVEATVFFPYLLTWWLSAMLSVKLLGGFPILLQSLVAIVALTASLQSMDLQHKFRIHLQRGWTGRNEQVDAA